MLSLSAATTDVDFVDACFMILLARPSDADGRNFHLASLQAGTSRLAVIDAFLSCDEFKARNRANQWVPAGHFYSPLPSLDEVEAHRLKTSRHDLIPGVDLQEVEQLALLEQFKPFYRTIPFRDGPAPGLRYKYQNSSFPNGDAIALHCMLRHLKPSRFIEVGCGNSSCVTLDTVEQFLDNKVKLTFIEPYPQFFNSLVFPQDLERVTLIPSRLQDVPLAVFEELGPRDILFIDSTHVAKLDSDVNHFLFEIFPRLKPGVFIHIHDVFFPFEYPQEWLEEGRGWNEQYILRAFLQFNPNFKIRFFNTFLFEKHRDWFEAHMPDCLKRPGGSIWLEKVD